MKVQLAKVAFARHSGLSTPLQCNHHKLFGLAKLQDMGFVLSLSAADVQRLTRLSASDVATLQIAVAEAVPHPTCVTGRDILYMCSSMKYNRCLFDIARSWIIIIGYSAILPFLQ